MTHTSKMELTKFVNNNGEELVTGLFYRGMEEEGKFIACMKMDDLVETNTHKDYMCMTIDENSPFNPSFPIFHIVFKISDDKITSGTFAIGEDIIETGFIIASNNSPFTGFREGSTVSEPSYDEIKKELNIPVINYQGSKYRVILENKGDFIFTLKNVHPI